MDDISERFWCKVAIAAEDECWHWKAAASQGYGRFGLPSRRIVPAHHVSFYLRHRRWPKYLLHTCDTPSCVNPSHLNEGDQASNNKDMVRKGRRRIGSLQHKYAHAVPRIRDLLKHGCRVMEIARWLDVPHPVVSNVKNGIHAFKFLETAEDQYRGNAHAAQAA